VSGKKRGNALSRELLPLQAVESEWRQPQVAVFRKSRRQGVGPAGVLIVRRGHPRRRQRRVAEESDLRLGFDDWEFYYESCSARHIILHGDLSVVFQYD
jgi:hypothetical protein